MVATPKSHLDRGQWQRIRDGEAAPFTRQTIRFTFRGGHYDVVLNPQTPDRLEVDFSGQTECFSIDMIHVQGKVSHLCGTADWIPEIVPDFRWYELLVSEAPTITYWGGRVIDRIDRVPLALHKYD